MFCVFREKIAPDPWGHLVGKTIMGETPKKATNHPHLDTIGKPHGATVAGAEVRARESPEEGDDPGCEPTVPILDVQANGWCSRWGNDGLRFQNNDKTIRGVPRIQGQGRGSNCVSVMSSECAETTPDENYEKIVGRLRIPICIDRS